MKKLLCIALTVATGLWPVHADDQTSHRDVATQQKIRDNAGNVVGYKEHTVNNTRYRDANQNIIATVDKKEAKRGKGESANRGEPKK